MTSWFILSNQNGAEISRHRTTALIENLPQCARRCEHRDAGVADVRTCDSCRRRTPGEMRHAQEAGIYRIPARASGRNDVQSPESQ